MLCAWLTRAGILLATVLISKVVRAASGGRFGSSKADYGMDEEYAKIARQRPTFAVYALINNVACGRPSKFKNHPDFVPSVFTYVRSRGDAAVRRHSRWWKRQKGELDTTATSATPNDMPELQDPPNENLNMDTSAAQDGVLDENSVDLQQLENENPDEGLDATKDDVPDQDSMQLQQPENGIKEHIWPDCRCQACASKKIEVLEQEIGNSQKFILQLQKQNAKLEVQLDAAMSRRVKPPKPFDTPCQDFGYKCMLSEVQESWQYFLSPEVFAELYHFNMEMGGSPACGYAITTKKGVKVHDSAQQHGLTLLNDPLQPTRVGNSVTRDTTPDLTFTRDVKKGTPSTKKTWHLLRTLLRDHPTKTQQPQRVRLLTHIYDGSEEDLLHELCNKLRGPVQ
ncbi:hypothetical protein HPB51_025616 [Rhipicephalus microplus]|uniref:Uncharacterized protein n=1 Tax=Rhipicephalus microplus TaxID=6941 RepID=A0A9J6D7T5_RHIMP|nr:hypothetical protein HPB51_025616 [Rhipicephalus microplus]